MVSLAHVKTTQTTFLLATCASHTSDIWNLCCYHPCYKGTSCTN